MRWEAYISVIVIILILGVIIVVTQQSSPGFSVVYFDNSTIPDHLTLGNSTTIIFVIESHENREVTYSFTAYLGGTQIKKGSVSLKPGEKIQIPIKVLIKNVTYNKVVLKNGTTVYNVSGILNVTGNCIVSNSTERPWACLPVIYKGPSNVNFVLNTKKNTSIIRTSTNIKGTEKVLTIHEFRILRIKNNTYRIVIRETQFMYVPQNIILNIQVNSSTGKFYQLSKIFPVTGG